jgi:hypothetical protein
MNNANIQRRNTPSRTSATFHSQPSKDEVSFRSLNLGKCKEELLKNGYRPAIEIKSTTPITVLKKEGSELKPQEAFLARTSFENMAGTVKKGLAIFSNDNQLLGRIKYLDEKEWEDLSAPSASSGKPLEKNVGKYLRLHGLWVLPNDYKGLGSTLIEESKKESEKLGFDGQLKVYAQNTFDKAKGSPIPFYAKKGFLSEDYPNMTKEELIEKYSKPENRHEIFSMFLLKPENVEKLREPIP